RGHAMYPWHTRAMAKKRRKRPRRPPVATREYADGKGNVLELRETLTSGTIAKINEGLGRPAASAEDAWRRRQELLFERLAVSWEIAGLPITEQAMLIGRYRLASSEEQAWVRERLDEHVAELIPELLGPGQDAPS
ncbi:MAG: hypothetical protein ACR2N5_03095, partial [Solirubrobacterales bacterium]